MSLLQSSNNVETYEAIQNCVQNASGWPGTWHLATGTWQLLYNIVTARESSDATGALQLLVDLTKFQSKCFAPSPY